jgi:hypothetical protein
MHDKTYQEIATLALEAADALWALAENKETTREAKIINQDIYMFLKKHGYPEKENYKL